MKKSLSVLLIILCLLSSITNAQELKNKKEKYDLENSTNKIDGITATNDKMTVKDEEGNVLMDVTDEGEGGSIYIKPISVLNSNYTSRLYNIGTQLYWNGFQVGTTESAGGWTNDSPLLYTSNLNSKVGIGTPTPTATLHVQGDNGVLFEGTYGSGTIPKEGAGTRMMWYPKKAAFRVGGTDSLWNDEYIGNFSTAMGNSYAVRDFSTGMGRSWAHSYSSTAMGSSSARGDYSTAMGGSEAFGDYSTAMGDARAYSYYSTAVGRSNIGGGNPDTWLAQDPLFEVGNSQDINNRSNALTVLKNGNVGVGTGIALASNVRLTIEGNENDYALVKISQKGTKEYAGLSVQRTDVEKWFIGMDRTTDNLQFRNSGSTNFMTIKEDGNVGIGTGNPQGKLDVNGSIYQRGSSLHADYVFEDDYELESIEEHTEFMWKNKHLKAIPKATVDENGVEFVEVGSHRKGIVEELEKAHIYISQLEDEVSQQKESIKEQNIIMKDFKNRIEKLEFASRKNYLNGGQ